MRLIANNEKTKKEENKLETGKRRKMGLPWMKTSMTFPLEGFLRDREERRE